MNADKQTEPTIMSRRYNESNFTRYTLDIPDSWLAKQPKPHMALVMQLINLAFSVEEA